MNLLTRITRLARRDKAEPIRILTMEEMRFSVGGGQIANTVLNAMEISNLMDKHHINYHVNLVAFIVDVEAIVRKRIAEQEARQPQEQQPKEI